MDTVAKKKKSIAQSFVAIVGVCYVPRGAKESVRVAAGGRVLDASPATISALKSMGAIMPDNGGN